MLGITGRGHKRTIWIRHQTGVNDIIDVIKTGIHGWAGHIARFKDKMWTKRVTEWTQREWTRRQGRPKTRWRDNLVRHLGPAWPSICRDRRMWKHFMELLLRVKETLLVNGKKLNTKDVVCMYNMLLVDYTFCFLVNAKDKTIWPG